MKLKRRKRYKLSIFFGLIFIFLNVGALEQILYEPLHVTISDIATTIQHNLDYMYQDEFKIAVTQNELEKIKKWALKASFEVPKSSVQTRDKIGEKNEKTDVFLCDSISITNYNKEEVFRTLLQVSRETEITRRVLHATLITHEKEWQKKNPSFDFGCDYHCNENCRKHRHLKPKLKNESWLAKLFK